MKEPDKYYVETLDMKDPNWKKFNFSKFNIVFHVAGIAHTKESKENKYLYDKDIGFLKDPKKLPPASIVI
jgi:UDP-glucose 4-epimerase